METDRKTKAEFRSAKLKADNKTSPSASKPNGKHPEKKRTPTAARLKTAKGKLPIMEKVTQQAQEELIGTRQRLLATYEHAPIGIVESSPEGKIINCNREFCHITGYTKEELIALSLADLTYEEDYIFDIKLHQRLVAGEIPFYKLEKRYKRKDGGLIWVELTRNVVRDEEGNALFTIGAVLDISERKHSEQSLTQFARRQEALYALADQLHRTNSLEDVFNAALDAILNALQCDRASILLFDDKDVMRFVAWRGLSDGYRKTTEGHSPWKPDAKNPEPVYFNDISTAELSDSLRAVIQEEGIGSLAFIPLVSNGKLIGKFMVYFNTPHVFDENELELSLTIARQFAFGIDRKRSEEKLRESEERYRFIVENTSDGIWWIELTEPMPISLPEEEQIEWYYRHAVIRQCNLGLARMYGYASAQEVVGLPLRVVMPREDPVNLELSRQFIRSGYRLVDAESRELGEGGREIVFLNNMVGVIEDGKLKGEWGTNRDITERKRAEEALRASEELYRTIARSIPGGGVYVVDKDFRYLVAEGPVTEAFGISREMLEGRTVSEVFALEAGEKMKERIQRNFAGETVSFETKHNERVYWTQQAPLLDSLGHAIIVTIDITERKRAEEALRASEERFVLFMQHLPGLAWIKDLDGHYVYANAAAEKAFNTPREKLYGMTDQDIFPAAVATQFKNNDDQALMNEKGVQVIETLKQSDGVLHFSLVSKFPIPGPDGSIAMIGGTAFDITERKHAEEALHESRERYRNLFDLVPIAVYACDADGLIQEYNHRAVELWGREPAKNDPNEKYCGSFRIYYPDGSFMPHEKCPMARMLAGETLEPHELEFLIERADGVRRNVIAHPLPLKNEHGEIVAAINCLYDITERKQAEEKIVFQANLLGAVGSAVVATDLNGTVLYWNPAAERLYGWPASDALGKNILEISPAPQSQERAHEIMEQLASGNSWSGEFLVQRRDGHMFPAFVSDSPILDSNGNLAGIIGVSSDITERQQAEEALRESEERFRAIIRQATAGIVRKDFDGRLLFVNQAFCDMLGYSESELVGKTIWELTHEEDIEKNKQLYDRMAAEGNPFRLEKRLIRRDSSIIWVNVSVSPIMDAAGRLQSAVAVEVDITGRKQAEQALQELNLQLEHRVQSRTARLQETNQALREEISERQQAEELLRRWAHIFEHADWGIATVRQDTLSMVNPMYAKMHGYTAEELVGRSIYEVHAPESWANAQEQIRTAYEKGHHIYESTHIRKDGSIFPVLVDTTVVRDQTGNILYRAVNIQDITERKRVEQELHESREHLQILSRRLIEVQEDERRAIARELHDRVGQTLAALNINLIIMNGQILEDSKQRIGSRMGDSLHLVADTIALVRNVMTDLRPAVLDDYGLEAALQSYIDEYKSRYDIQVFFEQSNTPIPRLDPGLEMTVLRIGQEALTNITRHAEAKQVKVSLGLADHAIRLTVQDDGVGIDSLQGTSHRHSHGLKIMRERAQAFGGSVYIESAPGKGTKIEARIPVENRGQDKAQEERQ